MTRRQSISEGLFGDKYILVPNNKKIVFRERRKAQVKLAPINQKSLKAMTSDRIQSSMKFKP